MFCYCEVKGDFEEKNCVVGTKEEVLSQEKEAEIIVRRIEEGVIINLSDISLGQGHGGIAPTVENQVVSDCESESSEQHAKKRRTYDSTCDIGKSTNSKAASLTALVCF